MENKFEKVRWFVLGISLTIILFGVIFLISIKTENHWGEHYRCYYDNLNTECGKTQFCATHVSKEKCYELGGFWNLETPEREHLEQIYWKINEDKPKLQEATITLSVQDKAEVSCSKMSPAWIQKEEMNKSDKESVGYNKSYSLYFYHDTCGRMELVYFVPTNKFGHHIYDLDKNLLTYYENEQKCKIEGEMYRELDNYVLCNRVMESHLFLTINEGREPDFHYLDWDVVDSEVNK